jgi:voltage-gated potassium channel
MRREPNYLYLLLCLLTVIVCIITVAPQSLLRIVGILSLMLVSVYLLTEHKGQRLLATLLCASVVLPFAWFSLHPPVVATRGAQGVYALTLSSWLLFTGYLGQIAFRRLMAACRIRRNEIYGSIYLYLLIGVMFAEVYQVLCAWQPDALYFDPGRFPAAQEPAERLSPHRAGDFLYYSFVTLCTVGYGDVTPASPVTRF